MADAASSYSGRADGPSGAGATRSPQQQAVDKKQQSTRQQVEEVMGIMRVNVQKVLERDQKLSELDNRADALRHGASQFEQSAGKLKRKYWWKNIKMMIIIGVVCVVVLIIIIASVWSSVSGGEETTSASPNPTST